MIDDGRWKLKRDSFPVAYLPLFILLPTVLWSVCPNLFTELTRISQNSPVTSPSTNLSSVATATALSRLKPKPTTSYSRSCYGLARQSAGFFVTSSPAIKLQLRLCKPVIARVYHGYPQPRAHRFSFTYLPRPTQNKVSHIVLYVSTNLFLFLASNNQV